MCSRFAFAAQLPWSAARRRASSWIFFPFLLGQGKEGIPELLQRTANPPQPSLCHSKRHVRRLAHQPSQKPSALGLPQTTCRTLAWPGYRAWRLSWGATFIRR